MTDRTRDEKYLRTSLRLTGEQRAFVEDLARQRGCKIAEAVHILIARARRAGANDLSAIRRPQPAVGTRGGREL